ncbi:hypothetical protein ACH4NT_14820 [Streptomyces lydicus]|uniref:hypothetical protein n=1 Tax=Streptomyces lydicus TaxID=47763 RepID=UPI00378D11DB
MPAQNVDRLVNLFLIPYRHVQHTLAPSQCGAVYVQRFPFVRTSLQEARKACDDTVPGACGIQEARSLRSGKKVYMRELDPRGLQFPAGGICVFLVAEHGYHALHRVKIEALFILPWLIHVATPFRAMTLAVAASRTDVHSAVLSAVLLA